MNDAKVEFDGDKLVAKVAKACSGVLRRMGAYVRTVARRKVKTSDRPSMPGSPPHSQTGALKRGILFGVEKQRKRVVIGPGSYICLRNSPRSIFTTSGPAAPKP